MNLLLLAMAFRAWSGAACSVFLRVMAAIAAFSLEIQIATWLHIGNIRSLRLINLAAAAIGVSWHAYRRSVFRRLERDSVETEQPLSPRSPDGSPASRPFIAAPAVTLPPLAAIAGLVLLVTLLAAMRPVMGADPYHLQRVDQITRSGTLAYDAGVADVKVNALAGVYELLLADLRIPGMTAALVRFHGLLGLGLYLVSIAAVAPWAGIRRRWFLITLLVVPVVFQQLVLVKNDLFGALPAFVALAWVVTRGPALSLAECTAAAALAGFSVGIKISSAPIALVVCGLVAADHRSWRRVAASVAAASVGSIAGGLLFTLIQNDLVYGAPLQPYLSLGNRHDSIGDAAIGLARFAVSLVDLGTVTPRVWPGRGGWGSTFGLPVVWALAVLALRWRDWQARRALLAALACLIVFGATYPDADVAQRMVIAPGLLLIVVALGCLDREERYARGLRAGLIAVIALSALQIGRSAWLYLG